jgi:putative DNA primase/helicase
MAEGIRDHGPAVEVYLGGRYFTFTIDQWNGSIDRVETFGIDTLARLAALMPKGVTTNGKTQSGDDSRSAKAMSIGLRSRGKSYDDMKEAIRTDPSTASWYTEKGVLRGERELQRIWDKVQKLPETLPITEDSLAQTFAAQYTDRLRYDHTVGRWYEWDGDIWRPEHTNLVFHWARQVCRISAQDNRKMIGLSKAATASAVEKFCRADRAFAVTHEMWDRDPWLLGTPNGTVDLRTGILREAMQADFITKATSVAPASTADCPVWLRFMHEVTLGDADLIRFLQQFLGYCLTGVTNEQKFIFIYGVGQNGKTTILETAAAVLSDYAQTAPMTTFLASQQDRHPTELAMLRGSRLVAAAETQEGRSWNEVIIKQVTGTDRLAARFMRQDFFTFKPEFKLFFIGNHKPRLKDVGTSTRRRFCMVPFMFRPVYDDKELANKLQAEHPAILRWLIDGCLDWQQNGLVVPSVVEAATDEYFAEQDVVAQWIEERCVQGSATSADALFNDFRSYVDEVKERPISRPQFTQAMERLGFTKESFFRGSARNKWMYRGIELRLPSGGMGIATGID